MIVYNLFVYFSTRDVNYLYYIGFVANYLFFHFTLNGYTFAYLWPNATSAVNAATLAETLRAEVEKLKVEFSGGVIQFTASFGVACVTPDQNTSTQALLAAADIALYQAKHDGRNCVRSAVAA
jgi:diguanylate cyclase (GGDEF)-like protein